MEHRFAERRPPRLRRRKRESRQMGRRKTTWGAGEFGLLMTHCLNNYDAGGGELAFKFDNATCRSRRHARWASEVAVTEGRRLQRGEGRRFGGQGVETCENWLTGAAKNAREAGEEPLPNLSLNEVWREVEPHTHTHTPARKAGGLRNWQKLFNVGSLRLRKINDTHRQLY